MRIGMTDGGDDGSNKNETTSLLLSSDLLLPSCCATHRPTFAFTLADAVFNSPAYQVGVRRFFYDLICHAVRY